MPYVENRCVVECFWLQGKEKIKKNMFEQAGLSFLSLLTMFVFVKIFVCSIVRIFLKGFHFLESFYTFSWKSCTKEGFYIQTDTLASKSYLSFYLCNSSIESHKTVKISYIFLTHAHTTWDTIWSQRMNHSIVSILFYVATWSCFC